MREQHDQHPTPDIVMPRDAFGDHRSVSKVVISAEWSMRDAGLALSSGVQPDAYGIIIVERQ